MGLNVFGEYVSLDPWLHHWPSNFTQSNATRFHPLATFYTPDWLFVTIRQPTNSMDSAQ